MLLATFSSFVSKTFSEHCCTFRVTRLRLNSTKDACPSSRAFLNGLKEYDRANRTQKHITKWLYLRHGLHSFLQNQEPVTWTNLAKNTSFLNSLQNSAPRSNRPPS